MAEYGYIRVSSRDQNEERQLIAMRELKIPGTHIFTDKQSGKDFDRPQYRRLVRRLKKDDILYIKSIDRLGRNYKEILEQWRVLTKEREVDIVVLDMPLLDTRRGKDLMGTFLSDIVLQVRFGRPPRPLPENFREVHRQWRNKKITLRQAAEACGMPEGTFYAKAAKFEDTTQ